MQIFTAIIIIFLAGNTAALEKSRLDASKQLYKAIKGPSISPESDVDEHVAAHRQPRNDESDDGNDSIGTNASSPLPTTPPIVFRRKCLQAIEKYIRGTNCTAGVNITAAIFSSQDKSLNASEYRKFLTQFCPSQKCLNMLTKVLNTCMKAHGLPMKNRTELIYRTVLPDYVDLFCLKEPKLGNFCGVLFPELTSPQHIYPFDFDVYCAIEQTTCSQECKEVMIAAVKKYGCCLTGFLRRRISPLIVPVVYDRCGISQPDPCNKKLRNKNPPCIPSVETNDTILSLETIRSSTSSPALEDGPCECQQAVHEFITDTTCSARVEFTVDSLLTESLNADEYRKLFSQVCKSQRCLNRLVKVLDICMKAQGFGKKNRIMMIFDKLVTLYTRLYCLKEPMSGRFCGELYPEFTNFTADSPNDFGFLCAIQKKNCSAQCREIVISTMEKYGCCFDALLRERLSPVPVHHVYSKCNVTQSAPCERGLRNKDPRIQ
jgi:hypothetical protein